MACSCVAKSLTLRRFRFLLLLDGLSEWLGRLLDKSVFGDLATELSRKLACALVLDVGLSDRALKSQPLVRRLVKSALHSLFDCLQQHLVIEARMALPIGYQHRHRFFRFKLLKFGLSLTSLVKQDARQ